MIDPDPPITSFATVDRRAVLGTIGLIVGLAASGTATAGDAVPKTTSMRVLERARSAVGRRTRYDFGAAPPPAALDVWPMAAGTDCSGFVAWCFGLTRYPPQYRPEKLSTDAIYLDAHRRSGSRLFQQVDRPAPADIVIYPSYVTRAITRRECRLPGNVGACSAGHVAILSEVRPDGAYGIIECALTPYRQLGDAIAADRGVGIFEEHARSMLALRRDHPAVRPELTSAPIFARYVGLSGA